MMTHLATTSLNHAYERTGDRRGQDAADRVVFNNQCELAILRTRLQADSGRVNLRADHIAGNDHFNPAI